MTRKRLFEIAEETKEIEDWIIAVSGVDKLCFGTSEYEETGFIINTLLPFLRDNEEFKKEFAEWLNNKYHIGMVIEEFMDYPFMLLGAELEFCREILKQEEK